MPESRFFYKQSEQMNDDVRSVLRLPPTTQEEENKPYTIDIDQSRYISENHYYIELLFYKSTVAKGREEVLKSQVLVTPTIIDVVEIVQDFTGSYFDSITMNLTFTIRDFFILFYGLSGILCNLSLYQAYKNLNMVDGIDTEKPPVLSLSGYTVVFTNAEELKRTYPLTRVLSMIKDPLRAESTVIDNVGVQIISPSVKVTQTKATTFIGSDTTMHDIIIMLAQTYEIKKLSMQDITEDPKMNPTKYANFVLPPQATFGEAMDFLQEYYGVYGKGFGYYLTNSGQGDDILYVFPSFDTSPKLPIIPDPIAHFYLCEGMFDGGDVMHSYDVNYEGRKGNIHIVISTKVNEKSMIEQSYFQNGNLILTQNDSIGLDNKAHVREAKTAQEARINKYEMNVSVNSNMSAIENKEIGGIEDTDRNITKFMRDNSNIYEIQTYMESLNNNIMQFDWSNAVPFSFKPGHLIRFHYDNEIIKKRNAMNVFLGNEDVKYEISDGVVIKVVYTFERFSKLGNTSNEWIWTCTAHLTCLTKATKYSDYDPGEDAKYIVLKSLLKIAGEENN